MVERCLSQTTIRIGGQDWRASPTVETVATPVTLVNVSDLRPEAA